MEFLLDSCIVIDIGHTDPQILDLLPLLGPTHFLNDLKKEADVFKWLDPKEIRLEYLDADFEDIAFANEYVHQTGLSKQDLLCLRTAARHGWTVITNDKTLRNECLREGIPTQYEFYLIFELVKAGILTKAEAGIFIRSVCQSNQRISKTVKQEALNKLTEL